MLWVTAHGYRRTSSMRWKFFSLGLIVLLITITQFPSEYSTGECVVSLGAYKGHEYTTKETVESKCLVESKWMRVKQHTVLLPGQSSPISDWLWIDYHDRINVLVEAPSAKQHTTTVIAAADRQFYVFQQSKYALDGRTSMAIIGGIIEPGEGAKEAASREVKEEMSVFCDKMHPLGRFRTDVNRGMGWVHSFLATNCQRVVKSIHTAGGEEIRHDEIGSADVERQDLRIVSLRDLRQAARNGDFVEVQWSNTVALALLHPELAGTDDSYVTNII